MSLPCSPNQALLLFLQIQVSILVNCESFHISFNQSWFDGFCFNSEVASKKLLTRNLLCPLNLYIEYQVKQNNVLRKEKKLNFQNNIIGLLLFTADDVTAQTGFDDCFFCRNSD